MFLPIGLLAALLLISCDTVFAQVSTDKPLLNEESDHSPSSSQKSLASTQLQAACTSSSSNGSTLVGLSGIIEVSPNLLSSLQNLNEVCLWTIVPELATGQFQKHVDFYFYAFSIDSLSQDCSKNVVEISYADRQQKLKRIGYSCGQKMPTLNLRTLAADTETPVQVLLFRPSQLNGTRFELGYTVSVTKNPSQQSSPTSQSSSFNFVENCGKSLLSRQRHRRSEDEVLDRLAGGAASEPGLWPWTVELTYEKSHKCGAAILKEDWLLTAASCFKSPRRHQRGWEVVVGRMGLSSSNNSTVAWNKKSAVIFPAIHKIMVHKRFDKINGSKEFDIALIHLAESIPFGEIAAAACLPSRETNITDKCYAVGWGEIMATGQKGIQKHAKLPILARDDCKTMQPFYMTGVKDSMICAGFEESGTGACQRDMGGPLVCNVNKRWELHGIASFSQGCGGPNAPSVFTRVTNYVEWLKKIVAHYSPNRLFIAKP